MSDIQRWIIDFDNVARQAHGLNGTITMVTYADAVKWKDEAVAAAEQRVKDLHHSLRCCHVCDYHTMPHRGCILR